MRPLSRIAIRSCTHSIGLPDSSCANRNPAHPPSRGCAANSSDRVGLGGTGKCHRPPSPLGSWSILAARLPPPATRERSPATRLTTLVFYFCSLSRDSGLGVKSTTRKPFQDRRPSLDFPQEGFDLAHDARERRPPKNGADMIGV